MKNRILHNWHIMRIIRLAIGSYLIYGGIMQSENLMLFFGSILIVQAIFNLGCSSCASGKCEIIPKQIKEETNEN